MITSATPRVSRPLRALLLCGVAAIAIAGCSSTSPQRQASVRTPDYSGLSRPQAQMTVAELGDAYRARPKERVTIIHYSAALRSAGQADQAIAVLEEGMAVHPQDPEIRIAYAKALTAGGRLQQALTILDDTIRPDRPDWNALSVKGAVLDQMGRNAEARAVYTQALLIAPGEPSLEANLGLSYAMTNDLPAAELHLKKAAAMPGATSQIRQNLALVIGLQGRFDESRGLLQRDLAPDQVEANISYIRSLLTQQNRWNQIQSDGPAMGGPLLDPQ